jgi:hypothetical protein
MAIQARRVSDTPEWMRWLACTVGTTAVFVRTDDIQMIAEYRVGPPPPLTSTYIAGMAIIEDRLALSVRVGFRPPAPSRTTRGIVLATPSSRLLWAFEVDSTLGLVTTRQTELLTSEPGWLGRARGGDRFLDVTSMVHALGRE